MTPLRAGGLLAIVGATLLAGASHAGAATTSTSRVACADFDAEPFRMVFRSAPTTCQFQLRHEAIANADGILFERIRWTGWGTAHPKATAIQRSLMAGTTSTAHITLSGRVRCPGGGLRYGRGSWTFAGSAKRYGFAFFTCSARPAA